MLINLLFGMALVILCTLATQFHGNGNMKAFLASAAAFVLTLGVWVFMP